MKTSARIGDSIWVDGSGPMIVLVDPPLQPGEVEISFEEPRATTLSRSQEVALADLYERCKAP